MLDGKANLDLHTDNFLSPFGTASASGPSVMLEGDVSHENAVLPNLSVAQALAQSGCVRYQLAEPPRR